MSCGYLTTTLCSTIDNWSVTNYPITEEKRGDKHWKRSLFSQLLTFDQGLGYESHSKTEKVAIHFGLVSSFS